MSLRRCLLAPVHFLLLLTVFVGLTGPSGAQQKGPPATGQGPVLAMPMPLGIQRGTSAEIILTGTNLADPVEVWTNIPDAQITIPADNNNGKDNARLRAVVQVPKNTPLGVYPLRLATARGVSNLRLFCVDDLEEVVSKDANHTRDKAQTVPISCVVTGRVNLESADYYQIAALAGQRLSIEVLGKRLGSPIDAQIAVIEPGSGRQLAHSISAARLQTDPHITCTFPAGGNYLIEVRDVTFRGGPEFGYRLRIGDFPCAAAPMPLAVKRQPNSKVAIGFVGPAIDGVLPLEIAVPNDPKVDTIWATPKRASGPPGWPVAVLVSNLDEVVEQEPNDAPAQATKVPVPGAVSGRFHDKSDIDHYLLPLDKGRYVIEAHTFELGTATEVTMTLTDAQGKEIARSNPQQPPRLEVAAPARGDYLLAVAPLYWGGPADAYRITVTPPAPGFDLTLVADRCDVPQGQAGVIAIQAVTRRGDFEGPIEVSVVGPAGLTGQTTIPAGKAVKGAPAPAPNPPNPKGVARLIVQAKPELKLGVYPVKIEGKAIIDGKPVVVYASVRPAITQALGGFAYPPRPLCSEVVVGVTEKPPFALTVTLEPAELARGVPATVTVTAARADGFADEISLAPDLPPGWPAPAIKAIAKGQNEAKAQITVPANVPAGEYALSFSGTAKFQTKTYVVTALPLLVKLK